LNELELCVTRLHLTVRISGAALFNPLHIHAADRVKIAITAVGGSFLAGGSCGGSRL